MVASVNDDDDDAADFDETETFIGGLLEEDDNDRSKEWFLMTIAFYLFDVIEVSYSDAYGKCRFTRNHIGGLAQTGKKTVNKKKEEEREEERNQRT